MTISGPSNGVDVVKIKAAERHLMKHLGSRTHSNIDIIDIRHDAVEINLKEEILSSLKVAPGQRSLPTLLLYDERGLQIFEEVRSLLLTR